MKTSLLTTFSVVGILVSGGAALAATTTVLDTVIPLAVTTTTTLAPVGTTTTTLAPGLIQFDYNIPEVGIVTLRQNATSLEVVSVKLVSGWVHETENEGATRVKIE